MSTWVGGVLLDRGDLLEVARLIRVAERTRIANGLPAATPRTDTLKAVVNAALADKWTVNGQQNKPSRHTWITTTQYANRTGCSPRTARRHAQNHGTRHGGRWYIPVLEEEPWPNPPTPEPPSSNT